jgi:ABC-type branched-subunit amino acid transport system substrate-binding protein
VRAYTYAVAEFNASQEKYQMQLIFEDGKCDQKDATSAAQKLIDFDKVNFLLGGPCSVETIGASNVAQQYGLSIISSVASAGKLSDFGNIIRYINDDLMGKELGNYVSQTSNHITIITENDEYGVGFRDDFIESYKGNVINNLTFNPDEKDFAMLARQVSRNNIDGVMGIFHVEDTLKNFLLALQKNPQI